MENLFIINEEEKNRILNLHESATKRHYLSEQVKKGSQGDPYEYKLENGVYYFRNANKGETKWVTANKDQSDSIKTKIFGDKTPETSVPKKNDKFKLKDKFKDKEYNTVTKDTFKDTFQDVTLKKQAEYALKSLEDTQKEIGKISEKTYKQIQRIKSKGVLKKDTFIVVNKDAALATLFGPSYKYLTKSSITSGKVKDVKPVDSSKLGYGEWRRISIEYAKKNPTLPESIVINKWVEKAKTLPGLIKSDGTIDNTKYNEYVNNKKIKKFQYSYKAREVAGQDITPGGAYTLGSGHTEKGYAAPDTTNTFPLINTETGEQLPNAVHGYAGQKRGDLIKQFGNQDVNASKELSRAGSGCINVDENFIKNINKYKPTYVIIIPDNNQLVDVKIVTFETWTQKLVELGGKCTRTLISLFS
jgi:hypothetical protein